MPHLPNVDFVKNCRDCGAVVCFSDEVRAPNGSRIPLEKDGRRHSCIVSDEILVSRAIDFVASTNQRLQTCQLKIVREDIQ